MLRVIVAILIVRVRSIGLAVIALRRMLPGTVICILLHPLLCDRGVDNTNGLFQLLLVFLIGTNYPERQDHVTYRHVCGRYALVTLIIDGGAGPWTLIAYHIG